MLPIVKTKMDQKFVTVRNTKLVKKELLRYYGVDSTVFNFPVPGKHLYLVLIPA